MKRRICIFLIFSALVGLLVGCQKNEADTVQLLLEQRRYTIQDGSQSLNYTIQYEYDSNNRKAQETRDYPDQKDSWNTYEYDSFGNCLKMNSYDDTNTLIGWIEFKNDAENSRKISEEIYGLTGKKQRSCSYLYEDGKLIKKSVSTAQGAILLCTSYNEYHYDGSGRLAVDAHYEHEIDDLFLLKTYDQYSYDENGNCIKVSTFSQEAQLLLWKEHSYDEAGRLSHSLLYSTSSIGPYAKEEYIYGTP